MSKKNKKDKNRLGMTFCDLLTDFAIGVGIYCISSAIYKAGFKKGNIVGYVDGSHDALLWANTDSSKKNQIINNDYFSCADTVAKKYAKDNNLLG